MPSPSANPPTVRIRKSARNVTQLLKQEKIDLTIGGKPIFVPLQPEGDEWSSAALGPTKLIYARKMARAFLETNHPGALISLHSGKHYPDEPIPRWQLTVQWRKDKSLWNSLDRLLLEPVPRPKPPVSTARKMMKAIGKELKPTRFIRPLLEENAKTPAAWVLPLNHGTGRTSTTWGTAGTSIKLIPGDSSTGLRMPLNEVVCEEMRTALTVSACDDGELEIFLPPMHVEQYDLLLGIIEKIACTIDANNLILSGYRPDGCNHEESLSMVSAPGVLEVNLPPVRSWIQHCRVVSQVYQAAHAVGLRTEKFLHNGEHLGTEGGSHLCFGGSSPNQSPFIRLPHLLPSIIRYWNHHPALSYLFTGQFVGPGCQAPRVDEFNPHLIRELELALQDIPRESWNAVELHQRLIHFFIDASGNTHRSEISMDKRSNPLLPNGNLGIIEFRAIESQPTTLEWDRVVLLFQGLITLLARHPYRKKLQGNASRMAAKSYLRINGRAFQFRSLEDQHLLDLKFRTFNQPYSFHPHIPGQCPLRFEWVNSAAGKVLDARTWHHWNPFGEIYTERPADHQAASKLRQQRWVPEKSNASYPSGFPKRSTSKTLTEDLRIS